MMYNTAKILAASVMVGVSGLVDDCDDPSLSISYDCILKTMDDKCEGAEISSFGNGDTNVYNVYTNDDGLREPMCLDTRNPDTCTSDDCKKCQAERAKCHTCFYAQGSSVGSSDACSSALGSMNILMSAAMEPYVQLMENSVDYSGWTQEDHDLYLNAYGRFSAAVALDLAQNYVGTSSYEDFANGLKFGFLMQCGISTYVWDNWDVQWYYGDYVNVLTDYSQYVPTDDYGNDRTIGSTCW